MSLADAIEALRKAAPLVPLVPSPKNQREPLEAAPIKAVPLVPWVPSEKTKSYGEAEEAEGQRDGGQRAKGQNGEVSNSSIQGNPGNHNKPLTEEELAALITREARRVGLAPADLWAFLSVEDLEAIGTGAPDEIAALRAFAESRSRTGERTKAGHDWPFPGKAESGTDYRPVCCGDCAHFERDRIGDGHGIGTCKAGMPARGLPRYPGALRVCRGFVDRQEGEQ